MATKPTIADLKKFARDMNVSASTDPSTSELEDLIDVSADIVSQWYDAAGINPNEKESIWQYIVAMQTLSFYMNSKSRGTGTTDSFYSAKAKEMFDLIAKKPAAVSSTDPSSVARLKRVERYSYSTTNRVVRYGV